MAVRNFSSTTVETTLSGGVTDAGTSMTVAATTGFPSPPFTLAVDAGAANQELVLVTGVAGTTLTVTRGYDSTVASSHDIGAVVQHAHTALDFREANAHVNATENVHGTTGDVVGTEGAQTLTDKTLTAPTIDGTVAGTTFGEWTAWTPAITAETGTITTVSAAGRYKQVGKSVEYELRVTVTDAGTGDGQCRFEPPTPRRAGGPSILGHGRSATSGTPLIVFENTVNSFAILSDGGVTFIATGQVLDVRGSYEAA